MTPAIAGPSFDDIVTHLDPSDVEAYPKPEPEERARYWEFREMADG